MSILNANKLSNTIVTWLQDKMRQAGTDKLEVDISGGVDSAVTAALSVRAAGAKNVIGVFSDCHSRPRAGELAREVAETFGFKLVEINFEAAFEHIVAQTRNKFDQLGLAFPDQQRDKVVFGSLRSTLRAPIGRFVNRAFGGGMRVGTGNRDEDELVRFYQKGGDGEVDLSPIAGLFKSEVWELAAYLGVPQSVIDETPTPDLWGNGLDHTDEEELSQLTGVPLTYTRLGAALGTIEWASRENAKYGVINGREAESEARSMRDKYGYDESQLKIIAAVRRMEKQTRHKAEPPDFLSREKLEAQELLQ